MEKLKLSLIFIMLLVSNSGISQSKTEFLASKICTSFNETDLNESKSDLLKIVQKKSNSVYQQNPDKMNSLINEFKKKFPKKNETEIKFLITNSIRNIALQNCLIFQKISQKLILPEPDRQPSSVKNVSDKLCDLLNESSDKSFKALNEIINNNLYELVFENKKLIEQQYGDFTSSSYKDDLNDTLMKECPLYLKLALKENRK